MEDLKTIKNRIKTIHSILKATSAMKMVSTIKLMKVNDINKYSKECADALLYMFARGYAECMFNELLPAGSWANRASGKTLIIVLSTDQGFCGSFNNFILDTAESTISAYTDAYVEVFGKKGKVLQTNTLKLTESRDVPARDDVRKFADILSNLILEYVFDHDVNEVLVISGESRNAISQRAVVSRVFPIDIKGTLSFLSDKYSELGSTIISASDEYTEIEGDKLTFLEELFQKYVHKLMVSIVTRHLIAELSARVMAMDTSVKNANDMSDKLSVLYNRTRQDKITQELTEIVSSVESIN
jgi:F-type H+-transporting ATPase subunit gamma